MGSLMLLDLLKSQLRRIRSLMVRSIILRGSAPIQPPHKSTVIIAPHPDDETFGCGGLIALRRAAGAKVGVIFMTRGENSHRNCCGLDGEKLGDARKERAIAAAAELGLESSALHWLDVKDGDLPSPGTDKFRDTARTLAGLLTDASPEEIYCPHPIDGWPDHERAAEIAAEAVRASNCECRVFWYLVWGWYSMPVRRLGDSRLRKARRIDVANVLDRKRVAIAEYTEKKPPCCKHPYVGALPRGFLTPFMKPYEIFFEATPKDRERFSQEDREGSKEETRSPSFQADTR